VPAPLLQESASDSCSHANDTIELLRDEEGSVATGNASDGFALPMSARFRTANRMLTMKKMLDRPRKGFEAETAGASC
jgi:hypothetical protein